MFKTGVIHIPSLLKIQNDVQNNSLHMASIEQKKADESVLRLVEEQKREKEEALEKILELERQLDAKQKLEMEIEELKGKLQVMKHLGDEDDAAVQEKIKEMNNELQSKMEEMDDVENLNQTLVVKERQSNDELQEARKELIKGLQDMLSGRTNIGVKKMGELDTKAFYDACKERFEPDEAQIKATELCSLWQDKLKNSEWHPVKVVQVDGVHKLKSSLLLHINGSSPTAEDIGQQVHLVVGGMLRLMCSLAWGLFGAF